ncbi:MAG: glycosyltransferase family 2 protein, partial [Nitrosopumilus sp.]|nr:glycosyltransferase family 2 protein [Nitrosopumilus sp.]
MNLACIPAYNEESTIQDVVKKSLSHVDKVIVCDDGSTDNTAKLAKEAGAIVISQKNQGYGAAITTLFEQARKEDAQIMITIDGDGQHNP